jgi:DNA-directed RNA polymerase subunit RPC12/RpoP
VWTCIGCGENVDDDFGVCWNCQRARDGSPGEAKGEESSAAGLVETPQVDGSVEVTAAGRTLSCVVCGHRRFHERNSLLNTRLATFFKVDWANAQAVNYICTRCGHIFWFWAE